MSLTIRAKFSINANDGWIFIKIQYQHVTT